MLHPSGPAEFRIDFGTEPVGPLVLKQRGLAAIVAAVAAGQGAGTWERLKACKQATCGWVFFDGSRNRSSSWCSMQICGGREKSRAYRRRRGVSGP